MNGRVSAVLVVFNFLLWDPNSLGASLIIGLLVFVWFAYRFRVARLKNRQARQEEFSRQLIASQESDRKRIAAELHDGLSQSLAIIKNRALSSLNAPEDHERAFEQLREIAEAATQVIDDLKEIIYDLSPIQLERLGLKGAIEDLLDNVADAHALKISREMDEVAGFLSKEAETNLYRIAQESVNNIIKHAEAARVSVKLKRTPELIELTISDDGRGFVVGETQTGSRKGGFGLTGIIERTKLLGGEPLIESGLGRGTTISIKLSSQENHHGG
jgi:signal transduction histidine kinase